jgi:L-xylulose reductase
MTTITEGLVVVTGAGRGLGRALSLELLKRGARVAGIGRNEDSLLQTQELAGDARFRPFVCDISDASAVQATFKKISRLGAVDCLINNAAVYPRKDFLEETPASFMQTVSVNLGGTIACTRAALEGMVQTGRGRILNVTTFADLHPIPTSSAYAVSKGAARIFSRALIADVCDRFPDIVISDWVPGVLATDMGLPDGISPEEAARWGAELALWSDQSLTGTLWQRDQEVLPAQSLKRRLLNKIRGKAVQPRKLTISS